MYPTTLIGLVLVISALHYAWRPDRNALVIVRRLAALTMLSSCLGFVTGCIKCFLSVEGADWEITKQIVVGIGESLNNIGLGLVLVTLATLCTTAGAFRARAKGAELVDPHAG